jgi:hypothetical protein
VLTRQDKVKLVIELYKQDKNIREIAKEVHMSFGDISTIIKKEFESGAEDKNKEVQAFELFSKGLRPLDVIMKLNMKTDEVKKLYTEYQSLCGLERINDIYTELGEDIEPFYTLYKITKEQGLGTEEIVETVKHGNELPILELKYENLKDELKLIENEKNDLVSEQENLANVISVSRTIIANLDQVIEQKTREIEALNCQKKKIASNLLYLMGSKEYKKVKDIAHQQVETNLKDKRALLLVSLVAIIEALKLDPEKQILIFNVPNNSSNSSYYLEQQRKELLELAEQVHNELANNLVSVTMNSVFDKEAVSFSINS